MKQNYNYARLDRGNFEYAPNIIYIGDRQIINASAEEYASLGWLPIVKTEPPESGDGYYFVPTYTEVDSFIIQSWERVECFIDENAEKAAAYDVLMGVSK